MQQLKKYRMNLIYAVVFSVAFTLIETIFRLQHPLITNYLSLQDYATIFLVFALSSFAYKKVSQTFIFSLTILFILQISHFNYFGYFIFPNEFLLFFAKSNEVFETLTTILNHFIYPVIYLLLLTVTAVIVQKKTKDRHISKKMNLLFILLLIIPLIRTGINYKKRSLGDRPNNNKSIIKNSLYVTKSFLGKTLPLKVLGVYTLKPWYGPIYKKNINSKIQNIILVIGESLTSEHMSLYGYEKKTTPLIDQRIKNNPHAIVKKGLSAGVFTDTSIPMILNIAQKPNAINHILSNKSNLFKLAKENNYRTYWISAQSNDGFSYIRNYMGINYIDHYVDSSHYGFDKKKSALDDVLIKETSKINLDEGYNFIVLNMIGSHSPYKSRVPSNFSPFGSDSLIASYDNTVAYTDRILDQLISQIKASPKAQTLLVFTSDHGQQVSINGFGHGSIQNPSHYKVPLFFFPHNFKVPEEISKQVAKFPWMNHYSMSLITAYFLGYETLPFYKGRVSYVNGNELSGNAGYAEVTGVKELEIMIK